ncbi:unnamed protein product [Arabidopsis lyrata]|nr:unnamed protein product [Arabidopsis lyrata]
MLHTDRESSIRPGFSTGSEGIRKLFAAVSFHQFSKILEACRRKKPVFGDAMLWSTVKLQHFKATMVGKFMKNPSWMYKKEALHGEHCCFKNFTLDREHFCLRSWFGYPLHTGWTFLLWKKGFDPSKF